MKYFLFLLEVFPLLYKKVMGITKYGVIRLTSKKILVKITSRVIKV